jgi:hypothetical protein
MKKIFVVWVSFSVLAMTPLLASSREDLSGSESSVSNPGPLGAGFQPRQAVLYDNGPLITHPGGGGGGADASLVQNLTLGMTTLGAANQGPASTGNRMADDFVIPAGESWVIDAITVFQYQTGAPTTPSSISALNLQIWDGPPNQAGSTVVWGDLVTDVLLSSVWTNIYRAAETTPTDTLRAILANTATVNHTLGEGTYWIDCAPTGDASFSGPWAPPITILGQTTTGDALQYFSGAWQAFEDGGTAAAQGLPFVVEGSIAAAQLVAIPTLSPAGLVVLVLLVSFGAMILMRRRV